MSIGDRPGLFKVDAAVQIGGLTIVAGWSTYANLTLNLAADEEETQSKLCRLKRDDVPPGKVECPGFVFVAAEPATSDTMSTVQNDLKGALFSLSLDYADRVPQHAQRLIARGVFAQLRALPIGSDQWRRLIGLMPDHPQPERLQIGMIDFTAMRQGLGYCSGWESHAPDTMVWVQDDTGRCWDVNRGFRWRREDVASAVAELGNAGAKTGFACALRADHPMQAMRLCACGPSGKTMGAPVEVGLLPAEPKAVLRLLVEIPSPWNMFPARCRHVDWPLIGASLARQKATWKDAEITKVALGPQVSKPPVSVIVPVYGRLDLIEHQLLEFQRDSSFLRHAELIYVIDDPTLIGEMHGLAQQLYDLLRVPFQWISAGQNRGFSGANNLGAKVARADKLIFMNSDVFPLRPGWIDDMVAVLDNRPDVGVAGPRLLFPDGTLQHAGMMPRWQAALGLWTNRHPLMGMDATFDPAQDPTCVPLLTGACLVMRRCDFERVGGWDTGYLIGDFEDSDLCLKLREIGLRSLYLPNTELLHLERQSFGMETDCDLRRAITMLNAVRYNMRWGATLDRMAKR